MIVRNYQGGCDMLGITWRKDVPEAWEKRPVKTVLAFVPAFATIIVALSTALVALLLW